jgi:hypothetical protein
LIDEKSGLEDDLDTIKNQLSLTTDDDEINALADELADAKLRINELK